MKKTAALIATLLITSCWPTLGLAVSEILVRGASICDDSNAVCFDGRITYYKNAKLIEIRGRLKRAPGPGKLLFNFSGYTPIGEKVFHEDSIEIRGKYSEIINSKFMPPFSNQTKWSLYQFMFQAEEK